MRFAKSGFNTINHIDSSIMLMFVRVYANFVMYPYKNTIDPFRVNNVIIGDLLCTHFDKE